MTTYRERDRMQLTVHQLEVIADIALSHYPNPGRLDWEDLYDRAESALDMELPGDLMDPVFAQIRKHVQQARKEARE